MLDENIIGNCGCEYFTEICKLFDRIDTGATVNLNLAKAYRYIESIYDNIFELIDYMCEKTHMEMNDKDTINLFNIVAIIEDYITNEDEKKYNYKEVLLKLSEVLFNIITYLECKTAIKSSLAILKRWYKKYEIGEIYNISYFSILIIIIIKYDKLEKKSVYSGNYFLNRKEKREILDIIDIVSGDMLNIMSDLIYENKQFLKLSGILEYMSCKINKTGEYEITGRWIDKGELLPCKIVSRDVLLRNNNEKIIVKTNINEDLEINDIIESLFLYNGGENAVVFLQNMSIIIIKHIDDEFREELKNRKIIDIYDSNEDRLRFKAELIQLQCVEHFVNIIEREIYCDE